MKISAICVTYGRTAMLQEALACFLNQTYADKELVIYNTCPAQQYAFEHPQVQVFNCEIRPPSLGAARNDAIARATGDVIITFDNDDLYLPHYLEVVAEGYAKHDVDWLRINPVFYAENFKVLKTFTTWINAVSFTKKAWQQVQGYSDALTVGEDREFFGRLSQSGKGAIYELNPETIPVIYSWGNGVYHVSGLGPDRQGQVPAYERARLELEQRMAKGQEPVGAIRLVPKLEHDPVAMVKTYLGDHVRREKKKVCLVELGRFGDIVNILPIAQHIHSTYGKPALMVSREFASILEGVSYVEPVVVDLRNDQLNEALALAHREFQHVINCQIWGTHWHQERLTPAYNQESWRQAGFGHKFHKFSLWRPLFDRRDHQREEAIYRKLNPHDKPMLLVNVTRGISSPFTHGKALLESIQTIWAQYLIVDLAQHQFPHFYDVIGLMDRAAALVSIDTAFLHLAAASNVPTVALVNPQPWLGTNPRCKSVARIFYDQVQPMDNFLPVHEAIQKALATKPSPIHYYHPRYAPERRIYHVCERHEETNRREKQRKQRVIESWDRLYESGKMIPAHLWHYPRTALAIGEVRPLPFLKDVLQYGMDQAGDEDLVVWTNDDCWMHPALADELLLHCSLWDVVTSQRCDFHENPLPHHTKPPEEFAGLSRTHMGRDLFAATKSWLVQHWDEIPDFVLGCSDFDLQMACMVRLEFGIQSDRENLEKTFWPAELRRGFISHEKHDAHWQKPGYVDKAQGQIWNRKLFRDWASKHLPSLRFNANDTI